MKQARRARMELQFSWLMKHEPSLQNSLPSDICLPQSVKPPPAPTRASRSLHFANKFITPRRLRASTPLQANLTHTNTTRIPINAHVNREHSCATEIFTIAGIPNVSRMGCKLFDERSRRAALGRLVETILRTVHALPAVYRLYSCS